MSDPLAAAALNATPLLTPLTGIGRYTLHLARELGHLLPAQPWLFYGGRWSRELQVPPAPAASGPARAMPREIPFAHHASRLLQQHRFTRGARAHGVRFYHETNYLAFDFDGPMVVTVHDLSWVRHPEAHPALRVRTMDRAMPRVLARARHVIVDSDFTGEEVAAHYGVPRERITTAHLGVTPDFRPVPGAECRATLEPLGLAFGRYVLALGTLEPRKNLAASLAAHARLPEAMRRAYPLVAAGLTGWGDAAVPREVRAALAARELLLPGYVHESALPALYSGAAALVYPSLYEGFGLPPLEAMACGTPVIVSNRASLPEVVGGAGVQVDPHDIDAIAQALATVIEEGPASRARRTAAGIARSSEFTWRACAERTFQAYLRGIGNMR